MAVTRAQLEDLGFKKIRRKQFNNYHYTLIYPINDNDYLFTGYDKVTKKSNFKILWASVIPFGNERITYPVEKLGDLTFTKVKEFIEDLERLEKFKKDARDNQQN